MQGGRVQEKLISIDSPLPKRDKAEVNEKLATVFSAGVEGLLQPQKVEGHPFIQQQLLAEIIKMNEKLDTVIQLLSKSDRGT